MRRRTFLLTAGLFAVLPLVARAQPAGSTRTLGILTGSVPGDAYVARTIEAMLDGLRSRGWRAGENLRVEVRYNRGRADLSTQNAAEIVALAVDVIIAAVTPNAIAASNATSTIPVVFYAVPDPVGLGLVQSFARPGGNLTGFSKEEAMGDKHLDLLLQVAPRLERVGMFVNPETMGIEVNRQREVFLAAAAAFGLQAEFREVHAVAELEPFIAQLAATPNAGLVVGADNFAFSNRRVIIDLADRHSLPAIYPLHEAPSEGGLIAYSVDRVIQAGRAGELAGEILNGADPATMPVQNADVFLLAVNLSVAARLGLVVPDLVLAIANEVIE